MARASQSCTGQQSYAALKSHLVVSSCGLVETLYLFLQSSALLLQNQCGANVDLL